MGWPLFSSQSITLNLKIKHGLASFIYIYIYYISNSDYNRYIYYREVVRVIILRYYIYIRCANKFHLQRMTVVHWLPSHRCIFGYLLPTNGVRKTSKKTIVRRASQIWRVCRTRQHFPFQYINRPVFSATRGRASSRCKITHFIPCPVNGRFCFNCSYEFVDRF